MKKICIICGIEFKAKRSDTKCCPNKNCKNKSWNNNNPGRRNELYKRWYNDNIKYFKEYRFNNKDYMKEYQNQYQKERMAKDPGFKILRNLRNRLYKVLKNAGATKSSTTMDLVGCTTNKLLKHFESKFQEGMTWQNQGLWEIDHIIPCASFDLSDPSQQRECFHYTNLQPLWSQDNKSKGAKI